MVPGGTENPPALGGPASLRAGGSAPCPGATGGVATIEGNVAGSRQGRSGRSIRGSDRPFLTSILFCFFISAESANFSAWAVGADGR